MILCNARCAARPICQTLSAAVQWTFAVGLAWLCLASTTWAQAFEEEPEAKTYVVSYMIILFAVSFGLLVICRGGKRTVGFRREE